MSSWWDDLNTPDDFRGVGGRHADDLTKPQFEWLLAYTGLDDVRDALELSLKGIDRATYATLKLQRNQTNFRLPVTLKFILDLSDQIALVAPDTDLSEPTIRAAWAQALAVSTKAS